MMHRLPDHRTSELRPLPQLQPPTTCPLLTIPWGLSTIPTSQQAREEAGRNGPREAEAQGGWPSPRACQLPPRGPETQAGPGQWGTPPAHSHEGDVLGHPFLFTDATVQADAFHVVIWVVSVSRTITSLPGRKERRPSKKKAPLSGAPAAAPGLIPLQADTCITEHGEVSVARHSPPGDTQAPCPRRSAQGSARRRPWPSHPHLERLRLQVPVSWGPPCQLLSDQATCSGWLPRSSGGTYKPKAPGRGPGVYREGRNCPALKDTPL